MWHNYKYINVGCETKTNNINIIDSMNFEEFCATVSSDVSAHPSDVWTGL